jgi:hypothetical protein
MALENALPFAYEQAKAYSTKSGDDLASPRGHEPLIAEAIQAGIIRTADEAFDDAIEHLRCLRKLDAAG